MNATLRSRGQEPADERSLSAYERLEVAENTTKKSRTADGNLTMECPSRPAERARRSISGWAWGMGLAEARLVTSAAHSMKRTPFGRRRGRCAAAGRWRHPVAGSGNRGRPRTTRRDRQPFFKESGPSAARQQ